MPALGTGNLQKCLANGEYGRLKDCPLFESNFVQVTRSGEVADRVTMGIAASSPSLELPDLLLLAQPIEYPMEECTCECPIPALVPSEELQLIALLPLNLVWIYIHDEDWYQFKVRMANGCEFYLQLLAPPEKLDYLFGLWVRLLYRLHFYSVEAPINFQQVEPSYPPSWQVAAMTQ